MEKEKMLAMNWEHAFMRIYGKGVLSLENKTTV